MPTVCSTQARGKVMRLTRLDACGTPVEGLLSTLVSGFISVTSTPNYLDVEEISQADANGDLCIDDRSPVQLRWIDLSIIVCVTDPDMINIITGDPVVLDDAATPNRVGFRINNELSGSANFALELWTGISGQACDLAGNTNYGYWLYPWVKDAQWGEWVAQNGALTLTFTARAVDDGNWGVGPYNIRRDAITPATLEPLITPIGDGDIVHYQITSAPLPTAACGAVELAIP